MDPEAINAFITTFGISGVFIFLYVRERQLNVEIIRQHIEDLREIAGLRQNIQRVQSIVKQTTNDKSSLG